MHFSHKVAHYREHRHYLILEIDLHPQLLGLQSKKKKKRFEKEAFMLSLLEWSLTQSFSTQYTGKNS